ncbi:MAG: type II secretion system protein [Phycisphaeraceae bacterium JB051]
MIERQCRYGFTLIEVLVVISIISLLIAVLLPALAKARESSRKIECASRMKQIGVVTFTYVGDYNNWLPFLPDYWKYRLDDYVKLNYGMGQIFYCPDALPIPRNKYSSTNKAYSANFWINPAFSSQSGSYRYAWKIDQLELYRKSPLSDINWVKESRVIADWNYTCGNYNVGTYYRHLSDTQANLLWLDGHVTSLMN